jgi:HAD superfamily hydrolase (TIGR01450 family)
VTAVPLADAYDLVIVDLDGVVYLIDRPIPGAVEALGRLRERGVAVAYATNNASRRSEEIADLLTGLGIPAEPGEVLTSARAAATALAQRHPAGSAVLVVGADALRDEVRHAGLHPVDRADAGPVAVVQGYGPRVGWAELAQACVAVRDGADWVVTNLDATLPSSRGPLPGNGSLVAALRTATDREPDLVVGKPAPGLFTAAATRVRAARPLVVGDRLDTDIAGAVRAGMDSLLVLTGITGPAGLLAAGAHERPTYVASDLSGLFTVEDAAPLHSGGGTGDWAVHRTPKGLELSGTGTDLDALRALCVAAWSHVDGAGVTAAGDPAAGALRRLGLAG